MNLEHCLSTAKGKVGNVDKSPLFRTPYNPRFHVSFFSFPFDSPLFANTIPITSPNLTFG